MKKWKYLKHDTDRKSEDSRQQYSSKDKNTTKSRASFSKYTPTKMFDVPYRNGDNSKNNSHSKINTSQQRFTRKNESFASNGQRSCRKSIEYQYPTDFAHNKYKTIQTDMEDIQQSNTNNEDLNSNNFTENVPMSDQQLLQHNSRKSGGGSYRKLQRKHDRRLTEIDGFGPQFISIQNKQQKMFELQKTKKIKEKVKDLRKVQIQLHKDIDNYMRNVSTQLIKLHKQIKQREIALKRANNKSEIVSGYQDYTFKVNQLQRQKKVLLESLRKI